MTGCRIWREELGAWLDGELAAEAAALFEAHLPDCEGCNAALEAERGLDAQLAALPRIEASPQFEARFWARLARSADETPGRQSSWRSWKGSSWRALLAEVALVGAGVGALAWLVTLGDPSLPETDWEIVAEADRFEMLLDEDLELLFALEVLEAWDGSEEI